jgi:serine protease Do
MQKFVRAFLFFLSFGIVSYTAHAALPLVQGDVTKNSVVSGSLAPMLKKVLPAIVNISVRGEVPLMASLPGREPGATTPNEQVIPGLSQKFDGFGSGVIVDAEHGYVLTNAHVIKDAQLIMVNLKDGRRLRAKVIGYDVPSDIAVLQIHTKYLNALQFGDSDKLNVGDFVAAIGSPFGLQQTVTSGVVSGLERSNLGIEGYENFIQTDAPINPGNSGGALLNMQGDLIGINTAIITPLRIGGSVGIGLAIPSNMARSVMDQLIQYGKVKRGLLGVVVQNVTPELAEAMHLSGTDGALVSQVIPGSPADKVGIQPRDVIIKLNGKEIHNSTQVSNMVSLLRVGTRVEIELQRQNKFQKLATVIVDAEGLQKEQSVKAKQVLAGVELRSFNQLVDNQQIKGVEVLYVDDTSIAYSSGLRPGDIILMAAEKAVQNIEELKALADKNQKLLLEIKRGGGGNIFLVVEE